MRTQLRDAKEVDEAVRRRRVEASGEDAGRAAVQNRTINLNNRGCRPGVCTGWEGGNNGEMQT